MRLSDGIGENCPKESLGSYLLTATCLKRETSEARWQYGLWQAGCTTHKGQLSVADAALHIFCCQAKVR